MCEILDDWLNGRRPHEPEEYDCDPLVSTPYGRIHPTTVTAIVYNWSRSCLLGPCPNNRTPEDCEAASYEHASKCPESVSSHAVRRGSITSHLESDIPTEVVLARANVAPGDIEKHYDRRSEDGTKEEIPAGFMIERSHHPNIHYPSFPCSENISVIKPY